MGLFSKEKRMTKEHFELYYVYEKNIRLIDNISFNVPFYCEGVVGLDSMVEFIRCIRKMARKIKELEAENKGLKTIKKNKRERDREYEIKHIKIVDKDILICEEYGYESYNCMMFYDTPPRCNTFKVLKVGKPSKIKVGDIIKTKTSSHSSNNVYRIDKKDVITIEVPMEEG